ncbi:MAG: EamA family transporter [Ignavibacteriales bacterium]
MNNLFIENWFLILIVSGMFSGLSSLYQKISLKDKQIDPITFCIYFQLLVGLLSIPTAFSQPIKIDLNCFSFLTISLMGIVYAAASYLYFYTLKKLEMSEFNILISSSLLLLVFGAYFFLGEKITSLKLIGVCLIILGISLIYIKKTGFSRLGKEHALVILCALISTVASILDKININYFSSAPLYMIFSYFLPAFILIMLNPIKSVKQLLNIQFFKLSLILSIVFNFLSSVLFFKVLQIGSQISLVSPIHHISIVFSVFFGIVFLKESSGWQKKIAGSIIIFIGAFFLKSSI